MTKISGYEDCHIVNEKSCKICCGAGYTYEPERYEDGSISRTVYQVPCECIKNGGEIRQGDVGGSTNPTRPEGGLEPKIHGTSPTYTREELSALIATKMCDYGEYYSYNTDGMADAAIDALIALGVVKCK